MADICIIYSRDDAGDIPPMLEKVLTRRGWSVWWDRLIVGNFRKAIQDQIPVAKCVIPVWSQSARDKPIVHDEAELAVHHGVALIPVRIAAAVRAPIGFGGINYVDVFDWDGREEHPGIEELIKRLELILPAAPHPHDPPLSLQCGTKQVAAPALYFSVSSHETKLLPGEALPALTVFGTPTVLASAYDVFKSDDKGARIEATEVIEALCTCRSSGANVLLDSGNYEASRLRDSSWTPEKLHEALRIAPHDWAFCFDRLDPDNDADAMVEEVVAAVERDRVHTCRPMLPIVHAPRLENGAYALEHIPSVIRRIAEQLKPPLIGIPERELGQGIVERAANLLAIRRELDHLSFYQPLHLLGTGNPLSIAILLAAGADSFDGLEWCRVVADGTDYRLYHFDQYDFFRYQDDYALSAITREAAEDPDIHYPGKVIFHNLEVFSRFFEKLKVARVEGKLPRFLSPKLPEGTMEQLEAALPGVL